MCVIVNILILLAGIPVEGKSSVCLIGMKYRIIMLIKYYHYQPGSNSIVVYCKHIMHAHTHTHTPPWRSGHRCSMGQWHPTVMARSDGDNGRRCVIEINTSVLCVFRV